MFSNVKSSVFFLLLAGCATVAPVESPRTETVTPPKRVVAVNSSVAELVEALGAGDSLVRETTDGEKRGLHPYRYSVEDVLAFGPDLLVASADNINDEKAEQIRQAGIPVLVLSNSGGPAETLAERALKLGEVYGQKEKAQALVDGFNERLSAASKTFAEPPRVMFIYPRGPGNHLVYGRTTGVERLIQAAGGVNAMDGEENVVLTSEIVIAANPDVILVMNRALERLGGEEAILDFPGVIETNAGQNGRVIAIDDTARWVGVRFPEFVKALAEDSRFTR